MMSRSWRLAALVVPVLWFACSDEEPSTSSDATAASGAGASSEPQSGSGSGGNGAGASSSGVGGGEPSGAWSFYGTPWSADSLANWDIGGPKHQRWSYRFRVPRSGEVDHLRVFFVSNPMDLSKTGYAAGTGGAVHLELCPDDGTALHAPDCTTPLGAVDKSDFELVEGAPQAGYDQANTDFPALAFPTPVAVTAGTLYHAVFSNIDPSPDDNYIGLDGLIENETTTPAPVRPSFVDWGLLLGDLDAGTWTDWTTPDSAYIDTPVMAVAYTDGAVFGCGYMEVWPSDTQARAVDGVGRVRERFTASRDLSVTGIGVRVKRTGDGGTLIVRVESDSGRSIGEMVIDGDQVPADRHGWVSGFFDEPLSLVEGQSYHVVLEAQEGGAFLAHCVRDGQSWTFEPGSVFADGYAEFDRGDGQGFLGWYGWSDAGDPDHQDGDLQLYFALE